MSLFDAQDDGFKGAIHGATLVLCAEMAAYNACVYRRRRGAWHLVSASIYVGMCALEAYQLSRHVRGHQESPV